MYVTVSLTVSVKVSAKVSVTKSVSVSVTISVSVSVIISVTVSIAFSVTLSVIVSVSHVPHGSGLLSRCGGLGVREAGSPDIPLPVLSLPLQVVGYLGLSLHVGEDDGLVGLHLWVGVQEWCRPGD